jgi:hypothetical protein
MMNGRAVVVVVGNAVVIVDGTAVVVVGGASVVAVVLVAVTGTTLVAVAGRTVVAVPGSVVEVPWTIWSSDGNWPGLRNTMMQAMATRQPPAMPNSFRLRSVEPSSAAMKNPLNKKNRAMLTELLTS